MYTDDALGFRLKHLRLQKKMTAREVAERLEVSPSYISMVEKGKCNISLKTLRRILNVYGESFGTFFQAEETSSRVHKLSEMQEVVRESETIEMRLLRTHANPTPFKPYYFCIQPGAEIEMVHHEGTEFLIVVEGELCACLINPKTRQEERHILGRWESTHYNCAWFHGCKNNGEVPCVFLVVYSPTPYVEPGEGTAL